MNNHTHSKILSFKTSLFHTTPHHLRASNLPPHPPFLPSNSTQSLTQICLLLLLSSLFKNKKNSNAKGKVKPPPLFNRRGTSNSPLSRPNVLVVPSPMFGSNIIYDNPSPPLLCMVVSLTVLTGFHTLVKNVLFSSPVGVESHRL